MKITILLISCLFFIFKTWSQDKTTIQFDKVIYDFGHIKEQSGSVTCEFSFINTGKTPFEIEKVETSCGCTTPAYSRELVKPGSKGFIKITYNPANNSGSFSKLITVKGNLDNGAALLYIKGWVDPKIILPEDKFSQSIGNLKFINVHVVLGEIYSTSIDTAKIKFYNNGIKAIKVYGLTAPKHIKYSGLPIVLFPRQKGELTIYYNTYLKKDLGYVFDKIKLLTDDNLMPDKELTIVANIKVNVGKMSEQEKANAAKIKFDTLEHDFGNMSSGDIGEYQFRLKNTGKSTLIIYTINTSCGCTATNIGNDKIEPGDSSSIKVRFNTSHKMGYEQTQITVYCNDPENPVIKLAIKANVLINTKK